MKYMVLIFIFFKKSFLSTEVQSLSQRLKNKTIENKTYIESIKLQIQTAASFYSKRIKENSKYKFPIQTEEKFFNPRKDPEEQKKLIDFLSITNYNMRPEVLFGEDKKEVILDVNYLQSMYTYYFEKKDLTQLTFYFDKLFLQFIRNSLLHDDFYLLDPSNNGSWGSPSEYPMKSNIFAFLPSGIQQNKMFWVMLFCPEFELKIEKKKLKLIGEDEFNINDNSIDIEVSDEIKSAIPILIGRLDDAFDREEKEVCFRAIIDMIYVLLCFDNNKYKLDYFETDRVKKFFNMLFYSSHYIIRLGEKNRDDIKLEIFNFFNNQVSEKLIEWLGKGDSFEVYLFFLEYSLVIQNDKLFFDILNSLPIEMNEKKKEKVINIIKKCLQIELNDFLNRLVELNFYHYYGFDSIRNILNLSYLFENDIDNLLKKFDNYKKYSLKEDSFVIIEITKTDLDVFLTLLPDRRSDNKKIEIKKTKIKFYLFDYLLTITSHPSCKRIEVRNNLKYDSLDDCIDNELALSVGGIGYELTDSLKDKYRSTSFLDYFLAKYFLDEVEEKKELFLGTLYEQITAKLSEIIQEFKVKRETQKEQKLEENKLKKENYFFNKKRIILCSSLGILVLAYLIDRHLSEGFVLKWIINNISNKKYLFIDKTI